MPIPTSPPRRAGPRDRLYFATPALWPTWPFLPLTRPSPNGEGLQLGVLYDALGVSNRYGYSATVFLTNLYLLPDKEEELLALPRGVYDTVSEIGDAGWIVD